MVGAPPPPLVINKLCKEQPYRRLKLISFTDFDYFLIFSANFPQFVVRDKFRGHANG